MLAAEEEAKKQKLLVDYAARNAEQIQEDQWEEEERLRLMTPAERVSDERAKECA